MTEPLRFVKLTSVYGEFEANVICAHLAAEGILYERTGGARPYQLSIGPMARVEIRVPEDDLPTASALIEAAADDVSLSEMPQPHCAPEPMAGRPESSEEDLSWGYERSSRPDTRPAGPTAPLRRRRAIG